MTMTRKVLTAVLALAWAGCAWVLLLAGLGSFGLLGPDEPRYAAIAATMWRHHDWITPKLWGAPWFEKPVLYYWLAAASDALTHVSDAASRLPNAILAVVMSAALAAFLWRAHSRRAGILAAFLSLSSVFWFGFGRAATTDMTLVAPLALALMALYAWWHRGRARWLNAAAVLLALAVLAKGPVAVVLSALTLLGFAATQGAWRRAFTSLRPLPVILFFAVATPWYVAVEMKNHGFFGIFFWQQNLERFATNRYQHPQAFWFYLPVILLAVFPWTGWLGLPLARLLRRLRERGWRAWEGDDAPLKFYLGCWFLAPLVFFSLSQSKLPSYILPSVPPAIALVAVCAAERWEALPRWPLMISAILAGLVPPALRLTPYLVTTHGLQPPLQLFLVDPTLWIWGVGTAVVLLALVLRRRPAAVMAATVALMLIAVAALTHPPLSTAIDAGSSGRPLARALQAQCGASLPHACAGTPLYVWDLNRNLLYPAQFYLGAELTPLPTQLPGAALIVMEKTQMPAFVTRFGTQLDWERMPGFQPVATGGALTPWEVVRAAPKPRRQPFAGAASFAEGKAGSEHRSTK